LNGVRLLAKAFVIGALVAWLLFAARARAEDVLKIGTDASTQASVIAEILRQTALPASASKGVETAVTGDLFDSVLALIEGRIDIYPVGLDRLAREIVVVESPLDLARVNEKLASQGLGVAVPLGIKRTYALAVSEEFARTQHLKTISDVLAKAKIRYGFSSAFMADRGGFARLTKQGTFRKDAKVKELQDHDREAALKAKQIDVIEVIPTDPAIRKFHLTLLTDDQNYFASHDVVLLHRLDVVQRYGDSWNAILALENGLTEIDLLDLNSRVASGESKVVDAVSKWRSTRPSQSKMVSEPLPRKIMESTVEKTPEVTTAEPRPFLHMAKRHVALVFSGLFFSIAIGIPLGIWSSGRSTLARLIFAGTKFFSIMPFLALLVFSFVACRQFGPVPAMVALFAYGLWPIVSYTVAGLRSVSPQLIDAATLQNISGRARISALDLPLAMGAIGQGIRRCAVGLVGTATVAALFGAGGFGEAILAGITNDNPRQMLTGAIAATFFALVIYFVFSWVARAITPMGVEPLSSPEG
jgi:osmoprotectant transport system permease protein